MKNLILSIFILVHVTSCTFLSKDHYLKVDCSDYKLNRSSCGYFDSDCFTFGMKNMATIVEGGQRVEVCSKVFHEVDIATGPFIPIIPYKRDHNVKSRWIKIMNHGPLDIALDSIFLREVLYGDELLISSTRYPDQIDEKQKWNPSTVKLRISSGQHYWIQIPESEEVVFRVYIGQKIIPIKMIESHAYAVRLVTV